jgi:hypothetical protein
VDWVSTVYSCDDNLKTKRVLTLKLWRFVRDGVGDRTVCFFVVEGEVLVASADDRRH